MNNCNPNKDIVAILSFLFLFLIAVTPNENNIKSYGQMLDTTYINENCDVSIKYPSDWKIEEKTLDDATRTINYIVELQPNNDEGFNSVVRIELNDISYYLDKSLESIRLNEERNITMGAMGVIERSETISIAGHNAQNCLH
jgi:hypothetical protein